MIPQQRTVFCINIVKINDVQSENQLNFRNSGDENCLITSVGE